MTGTRGAEARERWGQDKRDCFHHLKPAALILVATDGPVSVTLWSPGGHEAKRRLGHNRGVWPAKFVRSSALRDTATPTYDKGPLFFCGAQFRLWFLSEAHRDSVVESALDLIALRAEADGGLEALDHGFQDLGPDLDLAFFEMEMTALGRRVAGHCFDDDGLSRFLDQVVAAVARDKRERRLRARTVEHAWEAVATELAGR